MSDSLCWYALPKACLDTKASRLLLPTTPWHSACFIPSISMLLQHSTMLFLITINYGRPQDNVLERAQSVSAKLPVSLIFPVFYCRPTTDTPFPPTASRSQSTPSVFNTFLPTLSPPPRQHCFSNPTPPPSPARSRHTSKDSSKST